jgi:uncharacterized membrane protein YdbT with pleckstrin-like domain
VVTAVVIILVACGMFLLARAWFNAWITEIAVTNRRVIYKRGFISRTTAEMQMDKIESVEVDQSILGRILDYGKVTVLGTGVGTGLEKIKEPIAATAQAAQSHHGRVGARDKSAPAAAGPGEDARRRKRKCMAAARRSATLPASQCIFRAIGNSGATARPPPRLCGRRAAALA